MRAPVLPSSRVMTIMYEVSSRHQIPVYELWGLSRKRIHTAARWEAMAIVRAIPGRLGKPKFSTSQIGAFFHRDHSTVVDALRKHGLARPVSEAA